MGSFGERMQREREMRGITLEEIAESTKIGTRSLRALEGEDFDKLPGGIFNKGFVRAYARYLGIDEEQAVTDFMAAYGDHEQKLPQLPPDENKPEDESHAASLNLLAVGGAVALLVLFFLVWGFHERITGAASRLVHRARRMPAVQATAPASAAPVGAPAAVDRTASAPAAPAAAPTPAKELKAAPSSTSSNLPAKSPAPVVSSGVPAAKPAAGPSATSTAPEMAGPGREFVLLVRARQDAWVKIKADDELLMEGTLKGEKTVRAKQKVVVTTGNAGAIELSFNGEPQPALGADNQVKTVVFTPEGRLR